jgi:hypothetical protein
VPLALPVPIVAGHLAMRATIHRTATIRQSGSRHWQSQWHTISAVLVGATQRQLEAIYVPDEDPESVFVITAYELRGKARTAYRRRQRRKPR